MDERDRDRIQDAINDSQSDFEKNLVYLSSGALTLSIGFIEKIIPFNKADYLCILFIAWFSLSFALLLNLASHLISVQNSTKARLEMDSGMVYKDLVKRIHSRNKKMRQTNWFSYFLFALGVILIVIFSTINLY